MFCNVLEKITTPVPTASTAILKWKTYEALAKHLPPPLAAVGTVAMVSNSTAKRNSQSMEQLFPSLSPSLGANKDPPHPDPNPNNDGTQPSLSDSNASGMLGMFNTSQPGTANGGFGSTRQMNKYGETKQKQQILYSRTLGALPSSFFFVISNLCQSIQGVSKAFGDGYLRRALEKCAISYEDLELASVFDEEHIKEHEHAVMVAKLGVGSVKEEEETHQHGHARMTNNGYVFGQSHHEDIEQQRIEAGKAKLGKYSSSNTVHKAREDIAAVLRIVSRCANYNNSKLGSSNELIFVPHYGIIEMCCAILSSQTCPRNDPVFTAAMTCMCTFSKDGFRVIDQFIAGSFPQVILEEISRTKEGDDSNCLGIKHLDECLQIIRNFTVTMAGEDIITNFFPLYREHVMRIVRLHPEKAQFGNDVLWNMAKIGLDKNKHKGSTEFSGGMEQLQKEIKELADCDTDFDDPACFTPAKGTLRTGSTALMRSSISFTKEALASVSLNSPLQSASPANGTGSRSLSPQKSSAHGGAKSLSGVTVKSNVSAEDIASGAIKGAELVRRAKERKKKPPVDDEQITVITFTEEELRDGIAPTPGTYLAVGVSSHGGLKATTDQHNVSEA